MAVTIDIGDPDDFIRKTSGMWVCGWRWRLGRSHTVKSWNGRDRCIVNSRSEDHALRVWFDHAERIGRERRELIGFEIAGADGKYSPAEARIEGAAVVLTESAVQTPVSVRYGWAAIRRAISLTARACPHRRLSTRVICGL